MKIGDKVSVLDEDISGRITAINGNEIEMLTSDDFTIQLSKKEVVVIHDELANRSISFSEVNKALSEKESDTPGKTKRIKPKERSASPMEVDLHINQLMPKTKGLSNYDMLTIQVDTAKRQLEFAIKKRIPKMVFIHGKGNGVLKAELEFLFKRYDRVTFYDADYQKYGSGATEVYIYQNTSPS